MKDNEEVSDLREKLRKNRTKNRQSSIESRLYGSPGDDEKPEKEDSPKVQDIKTLQQKEKAADEYLSESLIEEPYSDPDRETEAPGAPLNKKDENKKQQKKKKQEKPVKNTKFTAFKKNVSSIPKYILFLTASFLLLFSTLLWYVFTDASDLKEINISGNELISNEEIENRLGFEPGDKMYSINISTSEENIALLPVIVNVNVERNWWNAVDVSVSEYQAVGYIENEGNYNPLLENARILRGYQTSPQNAPLVHHFEGEEMDDLVENLNDIEPEILAGMSEIYYRPSDNSLSRIHILMNDGQEIVADYRDFGEKMNHYPGMKEEIGSDNSGIIDMEIGSSFLPYDSTEARQIKSGIYNSPETSGYVDEVNTSFNSVKDALNQFEVSEDE